MLDAQLKKLTNAQEELKRIQDSAQVTANNPLATEAYKADAKLRDLSSEISAYEKIRDLLKKIEIMKGESTDDRRKKIDEIGLTLTSKNAEYTYIKGGRAIDLPTPSVGDIKRGEKSIAYSDSLYRAGNVYDRSVNTQAISVSEGFGKGAADYVSSLGSQGEQVASAMRSSIGASVQDISSGIWDWATGVGTFQDMVLNLGETIAQTILQTVIQIGVQWLVSAALAKVGLIGISTTESALRAKSTAETVASETAKTPSLMANAAAASAGSFGLAAVIGIALLLAMMAMFSGGREKGGDVQSGRAYIVGEKRPELFLPGMSGTIIPSLDSLGVPATGSSATPAAGAGLAAGAALVGAAAASRRDKPTRTVVVDNRRAADQLKDDPNFKTYIQDMITGDPSAFGIPT